MKKSIIQVTLEYLQKNDPDATGFTKKQIFNALIPATKGLSGYNPYILNNELGAAIAGALKNKRRQFIDYNESNTGNLYFLTPYEKEIEIPAGYYPYIAKSSSGKSVTTHLFKIRDGKRVLLCSNKIKQPIFNQKGNKDLCHNCSSKATHEELQSKYELLKICYDQLKKENNVLQLKNNELESKLLQEA